MLLQKKEDLLFMLENTFKGEFLIPLIENLKVKYLHDYDDYNEVYHCNQLIHVIENDPNLTLDYHVLYNQGECLGLALISYGQIDSLLYLGIPDLIKDPDKAIILNYFHISPKGRGNGTYWLKQVIMPYYKEKGMSHLYLKSSHPHAFSLYTRLGRKISDYTSSSDNHQYQRTGQIFEIEIK